MIVYTKRCLCQSKDKQRLRELRLRYGQVEVRNITRSSEWAKKAAEYNISLPFYVKDGVALGLMSDE